MNFFETTCGGMNMTVLYTGKYYIFNHSFNGVCAVVERNYEKSTHDDRRFMVRYGNTWLNDKYEQQVLRDVHAFVTALEMDHGATSLTFDDTRIDCFTKIDVDIQVNIRA